MRAELEFIARKIASFKSKNQIVSNWSWEAIQDFVHAHRVIVPEPCSTTSRADELLKEFGAVIAPPEPNGEHDQPRSDTPESPSA